MPNTRALLLAIAATCAALVGFALYLQHVHYMDPCPLCIIQRYLFIGIGVFALAGGLMKNPFPGALLALASAVGGLGVVARHLWVLAHPGLSCGMDPMQVTLNTLPTATLMPWLFAANGLCGDVGDPVLGMQVPTWAAIWFALLAAALTAIVVRARRTA
jgi:disulfide bond formation protein DsbB